MKSLASRAMTVSTTPSTKNVREGASGPGITIRPPCVIRLLSKLRQMDGLSLWAEGCHYQAHFHDSEYLPPVPLQVHLTRKAAMSLPMRTALERTTSRLGLLPGSQTSLYNGLHCGAPNRRQEAQAHANS